MALALAGCSARAPEARAPIEIPEDFSRQGRSVLQERWWTAFDDPDLAALVERALAGNFDLRAAWDRLSQAEAAARRDGAALIPTVDGEASLTRTELTQSAARGSGVGGRNDLRIGIAAAYEIDLWGRLRALRSAARRDVDARVSDVETAAITLSAEIATTWYELVEQRRQLDVLDEQVETNERVLELLGVRYRAGLVQASDVLRQRQLLEATLGERPALEARAAVLENQLATLVGLPAQTVDLPAARRFPSLPPLPAAGLPAEVVARRPDVQGAFLEILAADERLAAAKADRYPRLSLSGSAAFAAEDLRDLFDNWIASFSANLIAPLIDGGRRAAEVDRVRATVSERVNVYGQILLTALREVEDALVREHWQRRRIELLASQLEISNAVVARIRDQYLFGASNYLDVLEALSTNQSLQRNIETARRELLAIRVDLHRAVAGAFPLDRPEAADAHASAAAAIAEENP